MYFFLQHEKQELQKKLREAAAMHCVVSWFSYRFGLDWLDTVQQEADHLIALERKAFQEVGKCQRAAFFEACSRCNLVHA